MKIGYLPLYIKLYDDIGSKRDDIIKFYLDTTDMFRPRGLEVITTDFCRIKPEFEKTAEFTKIINDLCVDISAQLYKPDCPP